jgi:acylphosphatase
MAKAVDVTVQGRVQGVSFRFYTERQAHRLGVKGWVRNEPDGSVAGHFEGDRARELVDWCRHGPSFARVEGVAVDEVPDQGARDFRIRF